MKRMNSSSRAVRRALLGPVLAGALTVVACGNEVNFSPTAPDWPEPVAGIRTLEIVGSLSAEDGTCLEATVLYDGQELAGARSRCPRERGCVKLDLEASVSSIGGHHTISFQVLRQSQEVIYYLAEGTVLVDREGLSLGGVSMPLRPTHAQLRPGGVISFEIDFAD